MKKFFLVMVSACLSVYTWAGFGILVNDCQYYAGTQNPSPADPSFQEYMCLGLNLNSGDVLCLYDDSNGSKWAVDLDGASDKAFTKNGSSYSCSTKGVYDFYIKLKYQADQLYIGKGSGNATPTDICTFTPCIAGNGVEGNPWCCGLAWSENGCPLTDGSITYTALPAGEYEFKITDGTWNRSWGGYDVNAATSTPGYATTADGNVAFKISQPANITIAFANNKITLTSSVPFDKVWTGSVPAQCPWVMLQGFYYDSYTVDPEKKNGTEIYGDTRWATLTKKAGEIGSYFDLVWLPPSSYASGTGYHPRQFSNQNSDWGSRAELETLIKAFHNAGTRVIADIVINHIEAMASWCDFSVQNFAEYGTFAPDGSWICNTDEMNWPEYKADTLAGECWGTATGNKDDGENWEGARDWSHDMPKVQDMFKAYLQWLKNTIGYDGWRYDKGDGYNNWHMWNYNNASHPEFAVMECWKGNNDIKRHIDDGKKDILAFDFQAMYHVFKGNNGIHGNHYGNCGINGKMDYGDGAGLIHEGYQRNACTFIENHDMFLRNDQEFGGYGNSMKPELKDRLLSANAYLLSMPGVPCVFYPHWYQYTDEINQMINARHVAGVHSESEVKEEEIADGGYKATVVGKNGYLIVTLGNKTIQEATGSNKWLAENGYEKLASGKSYALWVTHTNDVAGRLVATPECAFEDAVKGIKVGMKAVGGTGSSKIYYTLDGSEPTTGSTEYTDSISVTTTTTIRAIVVSGTAKSQVYTYTYTYREPLKHGIRVYFDKPAEWDKVYIYAWVPGVDETGAPTSTNIMGAYPGQRIYRNGEGWYMYEFDQSMDSVHFCINSGDDCGSLNVRSNDLLIDYDAYYEWESGFEAEEKHEIKLDEPKDLNPDFELELSPETSYFRDKTEGLKVKMTVLGKPGAMIYYSTDGSDPASCAEPAADEIELTINETSTVQAYAFDLEGQTKTEIKKAVYTYKEPQTTALTVRFIKPHDWAECCLYAFTRVKVGTKFKDTAYPLNGDKKNTVWPGMKWTTFETQIDPKTGEIDSVYTFTFPEDIKDIYVIFNIGSNRTQTQDINLIEDMCYYWNNDCRKAVATETCSKDEPIVGLQQVKMKSKGMMVLRDGLIYMDTDYGTFDLFGRKVQ